MPNILIIGATRGLGASLANNYASEPSNTVYGTTRSSTGPSDDKISKAVRWVPNIDLMSPGVGKTLVNQLGVGGGMIEKGIHGFDIVV